MAAPIFPMVKTEKLKSSGTTTCIGFKSPMVVCQMNPFTYNISKPRKCEHCGAMERLTTGECAYCRQP